ncbi:hypothetical protein N6H14_29260 [Paenibacillus sp. CC-CFT747]|nr:hypothetical protein N6H14_29260 [Paenibacillus sp. CC-CFT747]
MIKQYFTELKLDDEVTLSEGLQQLVEEAESAFRSEFIEVTHIVKHDDQHYTVVVNIDFDLEDGDEEEEEEEGEEEGEEEEEEGEGGSKKEE